MSEKTYKYTCGYEHTINFEEDIKYSIRRFKEDFNNTFLFYETQYSERTKRTYFALTQILVFANSKQVVTLDYDEKVINKYEMKDYYVTWDISDVLADTTTPRFKYEELETDASE